MFIVALFTIAGTRKQPKCLLTDEWIMCACVYIYIYIYIHIHTYNGVLLSFLMKWMNLEPIIQSEVSQKEKNRESRKTVLVKTFVGQ